MPIPIDSSGNERYIIGQPLPEATNPSYSYPLLPLFDSGYYLAQNPDVAAAGMPATYHYIHYGWKEGRDPSPYFDTSFYLELNPDVAAAGVNPLEHYNTYGWREGRRDPSPTFDTSYYLESNPDVAAAGMNPLEHYVRYGAAEGRAASPPVTPGSDFINTTGAGGAVAVRPDPADPGGDAPIPTEARRSELKDYAEDQLGDANTKKAQAFVNILDRATDLVKDVEHPADTIIGDLVAVLVGDDRIPGYPDEFREHRNEGPHYVEGNFAGSDGFQPQFQEDAEHNSFQVHHAMAGIAIAWKNVFEGYGELAGDLLRFPPLSHLDLLQEKYVLWVDEDYPPDIELYKATFKIGDNLSDENYDKLPEMVADTIGDETVSVPLSDFILIA